MKILENILKSKPDFAPANSRKKNNKDSYALCCKNRSSTTPVSPLLKVAKIVSKKQPSIFKPVVLDLFDINGNVKKTKIGTSSNICIIGGSDAALDVLLSKLKIAYRQQQNINLKEIDAEEFCVRARAFPNLKNYVVRIDVYKEDERTIFNAMFYSKLHIVFKLDGVSLNSKIGGVRLSGAKNIQILKNLHGKIQKEKNKLVASLKEEEFALMTRLDQYALSLKEYCNFKEVSNA